MLGNMSKDHFIIDRNTANDQPYAGMMVNPPMLKENLTLAPIGSPKLNGLYNVTNMPLVYKRAGQSIAGNRQLGGAKNDVLAQVLYPKRMPYPTS